MRKSSLSSWPSSPSYSSSLLSSLSSSSIFQCHQHQHNHHHHVSSPRKPSNSAECMLPVVQRSWICMRNSDTCVEFTSVAVKIYLYGLTLFLFGFGSSFLLCPVWAYSLQLLTADLIIWPLSSFFDHQSSPLFLELGLVRNNVRVNTDEEGMRRYFLSRVGLGGDLSIANHVKMYPLAFHYNLCPSFIRRRSIC